MLIFSTYAIILMYIIDQYKLLLLQEIKEVNILKNYVETNNNFQSSLDISVNYNFLGNILSLLNRWVDKHFVIEVIKFSPNVNYYKEII